MNESLAHNAVEIREQPSQRRNLALSNTKKKSCDGCFNNQLKKIKKCFSSLKFKMERLE